MCLPATDRLKKELQSHVSHPVLFLRIVGEAGSNTNPSRIGAQHETGSTTMTQYRMGFRRRRKPEGLVEGVHEGGQKAGFEALAVSKASEPRTQ